MKMYPWILLLCVSLTLCACGSTPRQQTAALQKIAQQADEAYRSGKFDRARSQYEQLLAANPKFLPGHLRLGAIQYQEGNPQAARRHFETALSLDPRNQLARYNLAMLHLNEANLLLNEYAGLAPQAANRERVLVLLSQLRAFGDSR